VELPDAYKSIHESFIHAGAVNKVKVNVHYIHSESITAGNVKKKLEALDGILVAPGFGSRGIDGKLDAVHYARVNKVPFFGICLGMQIGVIEFARNVLGYDRANSTEMGHTEHPVIDLMEEQKSITAKGGTMRLGAYQCDLKQPSRAFDVYGQPSIQERHRHRYEFNNEYLKAFERSGMAATGINPESGLVEIVELKAHPWYVGVQFHPELRSTVLNPHPLFVDFVKSALAHKNTHSNDPQKVASVS
jgi:CTP synthase